MIDGRRVWLVSGRVPYARLPKEVWAERIHAAKSAGFNAIETPIVWARHEPRPGKFDFTGDNDLRHFVELVGRAGMHCILGLGPYIGGTWDMGGLPPWLRENPNVQLRTANGPFLEACSRFITALAEQVRGWQVTAPGTGGSILLLQCESEWTCGQGTLAAGYLGEVTRYIREAGLTVPLINSNNLWQSVEGQIDGWAGGEDMLATMRQLTAVRPDQPRIVIDLSFAKKTTWGDLGVQTDGAPRPALEPWAMQRRLAEVLAGAGQFNLTSLCAGTHFGFSAGRRADGLNAYFATSAEQGCLIDEAGHASQGLKMVRRIATFASRFGRVLANVDPSYHPISVLPHAGAGTTAAAGNGKGKPRNGEGHARNGESHAAGSSVIHVQGSQGGVAFVFADDADPAKSRGGRVELLMPDGQKLPITMGDQSVVWCLLNTNITGRGRLDYANLCALGSAGPMLVVYGPAGSRALLSVNGSPVETEVPAGEKPSVLLHEGLAIVVVNEAHIDHTFLVEDAVYIGVAGIAPDGTPILPAGAKSFLRVTADGAVKSMPGEAAHRHRAVTPAIGPWSMVSASDYTEGSSARFAAVKTLTDLAALGCPYGYGWYRITIKGDSARKAHAAFPHAGDRLHLYMDGKPLGVVGAGPGAEPEANLPLKKGPHNLVVLADNLGRFSAGVHMSAGKGLYGDILEIAPVKGLKAKLTPAQPIDVLRFKAPLWEHSEGDTTLATRVTWTVPHRKKGAILMSIDAPGSAGLVLLNDKPLAYLDATGPAHLVLAPETLNRGNNTVQIALVEGLDEEAELKRLEKSVRFAEVEGSLTEGAELAFAKWEPPAANLYKPAPKGGKSAGPAWWKCSFTVDRATDPLYLDVEGLTKGQVYVNGRNVGRYFASTADGASVSPGGRVYIPAAWIHAKEPNDLIIFDEHGGSTAKVRLTPERG